MKNNNLIYYYLISAVLILFGIGGGYLLGVKHQPSVDLTTASSLTPTTNRLGQSNGGIPGGGTRQGRFQGGSQGITGGQGGGFTTGQVTAVNGNTVTLTSPNGSTITVDLSASTAITKTVAGTTSDIALGQSLTVRGEAADDGSIQAQTIQIRPSTTTTGSGTLNSQ